jgi:hypothetical protein
VETDFVCKNRTAALSVLDTMAINIPRGTRRAALLAVRAWLEENTFPEHTQEELEKSFARALAETDGQRKAREWREKGSEKHGDKWTPNAEPEDGAETECCWNAETKRWEPIVSPPWILPRQEYSGEDNES